MRKLFNLIVIAAAVSANAATFVVPPDREMVHRADAILIGAALDSYPQRTSEGSIETVTPFSVERIIKGIELRQVINVVEPGGAIGDRAVEISGIPRFEPGQRTLLFLERTGVDRWSVTELVLGKFSFASDISGRRLLVRDEEEIVGWDSDLRPHQESRRSAERFLDFVENESKSVAAPEDYVVPSDPLRAEPRLHVGSTSLVPVTNATFTATSYTMTINGGLGTRWSVFPNAVTFYSGASGEPGAPGNGTTAVTTALGSWTNDSGSNVNYVYGGTDSTHTQGLHATDGANTVLWERDLSSWGVSPFTCSGNSYSGTLGLGGITSASGQHTLGSEQFMSTQEGDVEMNRGLANCTLLFSNGDFNTAVTHEVGHTLGFRHSDQNRASSAGCSTDPSLECSNQAVMKSFVSNGLNAALQPWDVNAVRAVYPGSTPPPPPPCTPPVITAQPQSGTIVSGGSIILTVTATGTAPLSYQWYSGASGNTSSPISGAVSSLLTVAPTSNATYWVRVTNSCGSVNSNSATVTVTPLAPAAALNDFNGDRNSDLIWRNYSTGQNSIWFMNGVSPASYAQLPSVTDTRWSLEGAADVNGDGQNDLIWRNYATGQNSVWYMNGATSIGSAFFDPVSDVNWRIEGIADFSGDGKPDLLWRNYATGQNSIWIMSDTVATGYVQLETITDLNWHIQAVADFDGDGKVDIVWRNYATGQNSFWYMNGTSFKGSGRFETITDTNWHIVMAGDYNADGRADLVWRNVVTGEDSIWEMNNTSVLAYLRIDTVDAAWKLGAKGPNVR